MHCIRKITEDFYWVGANDRRLALFENLFPIPKGVSYNSYLLLDEKTVLFDTVDAAVGRQFLENIQAVLNGRSLDYLVIHHMEPDHCALISDLLLRYPDLKLIGSAKTFPMLQQFIHHSDPVPWQSGSEEPHRHRKRRRYLLLWQTYSFLPHGTHGTLARSHDDLRSYRKTIVLRRCFRNIRRPEWDNL